MQKLFFLSVTVGVFVGLINERVDDKYTDAATFSKRGTNTFCYKSSKPRQ